MTKQNFPDVNKIGNEDGLKWKITSKGRLTKIAKFEHLSNHWSQPPQTLKLGLYYQGKLFYWSKNIKKKEYPKWKMTSNGRQSKIAKFEYPSNSCSDITQTLKLGLHDQIKIS